MQAGLLSGSGHSLLRFHLRPELLTPAPLTTSAYPPPGPGPLLFLVAVQRLFSTRRMMSALLQGSKKLSCAGRFNFFRNSLISFLPGCPPG